MSLLPRRDMESDNVLFHFFSRQQVLSVLTPAGIAIHTVKPHNSRLFPLIQISEYAFSYFIKFE